MPGGDRRTGGVPAARPRPAGDDPAPQDTVTTPRCRGISHLAPERDGPTTSPTSRCRSTTCSRTRPRARATCSVCPDRMSAVVDTLRLTAEDAIALVERGEISRRRAPRARTSTRSASATGSCTRSSGRSTRPSGTSIPIALKDVISTRGVETTAGSRILARLHTRLRRDRRGPLQGGRPDRSSGKTNTDEFAMGSSTENSAYGPSRNPWDPSASPAARVAAPRRRSPAGLAPWGLGSDTGGSIKQPSALCGNVGLRPTYGTVSPLRHRRLRVEPRPGRPRREDGPRRRAPLPDHLGPRPGRHDDRRAARGRGRARRRAARRAAGRRPAAGGGARGDRARGPRRLRRTLALAEELGAELHECDLPLSFDYGMPCYYLIAPAEASSNLARYDGVRYGLRSEGEPTARCWSGRATRASAPSRNGASCSARTRSRPGTTTPTTGRRRRCGRSSCASTPPPSSGSTSSRCRRRPPWRSRSATRLPTRSRCTRATS